MSYNFIWPVAGGGKITSYYGNRDASKLPSGASSFHEAIDIGATAGTEVLAALTGKVSSTGYNQYKGNYVIIDSGNNTLTEYNHLKDITARKGQTVAAGQTIGTVGSTGVSTGPHLDFRIKVNGNYIDPLTYSGNSTVSVPASEKQLWAIAAGLLALLLFIR